MFTEGSGISGGIAAEVKIAVCSGLSSVSLMVTQDNNNEKEILTKKRKKYLNILLFSVFLNGSFALKL
jgi:hypothetical protein